MTVSQADHSRTIPTTGPALVARACALTPFLASHAAEAERIRKPVDAAIEALEKAEIFKLMVPRRYAGPIGSPTGSCG
jgi:hypothetical protein